MKTSLDKAHVLTLISGFFPSALHYVVMMLACLISGYIILLTGVVVVVVMRIFNATRHPRHIEAAAIAMM